MKIACVYRLNTPNVGDLNCCPADYFDIPGERSDFEDPVPEADVLIIGGGGLLYSEYHLKALAFSKARAIAWGLGLNGQVSVPDWLDAFDMLSMRDWEAPFYGKKKPRWVPCVSCMSPLFDQDYAIEHPVVVYDHHDTPIEPPMPRVPRMHNFGCNMRDAVAFIASGETVMTSSYHGAYWATLLGRHVMVPNRWRTSFMWPKHPYGHSHPDALAECRAANIDFWHEVQANVGDWSR